MMGSFGDTIFALATGALPCAVAIIRVSGRQVRSILKAMASGPLNPRVLYYKHIIDSRNSELLDKGMTVFFEGPASYTGEDCCEFHLHGSKAVVSSICTSLSSFDRVRMAMRGEFTQRAVMNGKLTLSQAEGIIDLIHATGKDTQTMALSHLSGAVGKTIARWRSELFTVFSTIEANIEFSEEHDLAKDINDNFSFRRQLDKIRCEMDCWLQRSELLVAFNDGVRMCLLGPVNAGKSTLMNQLAQDRKSIVSDQPGTTRDVVETIVNLGGLETIVLSDTAGLNSATNDRLELAGIHCSLESVEKADIVLYVVDADRLLIDDRYVLEFPDQMKTANKIKVESRMAQQNFMFDEIFVVSSIDAKDVHCLSEVLAKIVRKRFNVQASELCDCPSPNVRHHSCVRQSLVAVERALEQCDPLLTSEYIRHGLRALQLLDGPHKDMSEETLDEIFQRFCIGK